MPFLNNTRWGMQVRNDIGVEGTHVRCRRFWQPPTSRNRPTNSWGLRCSAVESWDAPVSAAGDAPTQLRRSWLVGILRSSETPAGTRRIKRRSCNVFFRFYTLCHVTPPQFIFPAIKAPIWKSWWWFIVVTVRKNKTTYTKRTTQAKTCNWL